MQDTNKSKSKRISSQKLDKTKLSNNGVSKSGRRAIVPAKESGRAPASASKRLLASDPKVSRKTDVIKKQAPSPSNRIAPVKASSTKRISSEKKESPPKSKQSTTGTRTSRAKAPVISSKKEVSKSGRNSSRGSARGSNRNSAKNSKGKETPLNFIVVGGLILLIAVVGIYKLMSNSNQPKPKVTFNFDPVTKGFSELDQAKILYKENKLQECLSVYNGAMSKINGYLDQQRDSSGNLPKNLAGYEEKLAIWNGFGKTLREQAYIQRAEK